jgi:alpha 1,2-mannosyltransferase
MKNCIIILLNNSEKDISFFKRSFPFLNENYLKHHRCDVILFHENDFPKSEIDLIKSYKNDIIFHELHFDLPSYSEDVLKQIPDFYPHPDFPQALGFPIGYRHMCRFFAGEVFKQEILKQYKYVWRLDTDSFIVDPIDYDVFNKMSQNNSIYGYINIQNDHIDMVKNLWETCEFYFSKLNKNYIFENKETHFRKVFYTNFEIFDMDWFRSEEYQNFYKYIDETAGIYKYRWGDHVLRYIALNSLTSKDNLLFFDDIKYFHSEMYHNREFYESF